MITLSQVSKNYDHQQVLDNLNLTVQKGEIVGLLGPNGAGKTTTLRIIAGVLPPSRGEVKIDGRNLELNPELKRRLGFLPENNPLYEEMTVEEYLSFWAEMKQLPPRQKAAAFNFVVDRCGIAEVYYRPINELSKGYRQRVGLSQAILTQPDILILDEPTEGLDPNQRQDIAQLIKQLGKERTVIISSHVLGELAKIATRMVIIHKGAIVADDTPERLKKTGGSSSIIELEAEGENILPVLKKTPGITKVVETRKNYFVIETSGREDLRKDLYQLAVKNRWTLLTLLAKERAIEEVFSELTSR